MNDNAVNGPARDGRHDTPSLRGDLRQSAVALTTDNRAKTDVTSAVGDPIE